MAKPTFAQLPAKMYELLEDLSPQERAKVIQATMTLFGDDIPAEVSTGTVAGGSARAAAPSGAGTSVQAYLDEKNPKNKGETLAVAARYRELNEDAETHTKADLKKVVTDARRNFDDSNFSRDINNAKRQAGFFNTGTGRDASKLSYYGQQFVDALPDRDAAAKIRRPSVRSGKKKTKKAKKKASKK